MKIAQLKRVLGPNLRAAMRSITRGNAGSWIKTPEAEDLFVREGHINPPTRTQRCSLVVSPLLVLCVMNNPGISGKFSLRLGSYTLK